MNVFRTIFSFQAKRLFVKRNIIVFLVIGLILILLVLDGKNKYLTVIENKKEFQEMQAEKVKQFVYYDQYANYGIKILYIHSPFIILHSDSFLDETMANINIGERLNISSYLSQDFSDDNSGYMDFFGILLIFVVSCGLFFGYAITNNDDYSKFLQRQNTGRNILLKSVTSTIILLNIAFIILIGICLLVLFVNGINLFSGFFIIILEAILNTSFFVIVGTIIGNLKRKKSTRKNLLMGLIIVFIIFIPLVTKKINQKIAPEIEPVSVFEFFNFELLMDAERRIFNEIGTYKNDGNPAPENVKKIVENDKKGFFSEIIRNENKRREKIVNRIWIKQTILSIFPVTFSISLNKEFSSCGGISYIEFFSYSQRIKDNFKNFILKKKFYEGAKPGKVEAFIIDDPNGNIFYAKSHLPFNFWLGVFLTPFYTVLLLFCSYRMQKKRYKIPDPKISYQITFKEGNVLFTHCENESIKGDIFNRYKNQENTVCLEKINASDFQFNGIKARELFKHLCQVSEVDEKKALKNLEQMRIRDLNIFEPDDETILKIYTAVKTAADYELIVLDDFLRKESRKFELDVIRLLLALEKSGKKIIYLSTQSYDVSRSFDDSLKIDKFASFPIDLKEVTLR